MPVAYCVCREVSLAVVAAAARELRAQGAPITIDALSLATRAGTGCGTCRPYMARAAITGEAILPVMSRAECAAWVSRLDLAPPMSPA